jgi:hypothetical protein
VHVGGRIVIRSGEFDFWGKTVPLVLAITVELLFIAVLVAR